MVLHREGPLCSNDLSIALLCSLLINLKVTMQTAFAGGNASCAFYETRHPSGDPLFKPLVLRREGPSCITTYRSRCYVYPQIRVKALILILFAWTGIAALCVGLRGTTSQGQQVSPPFVWVSGGQHHRVSRYRRPLCGSPGDNITGSPGIAALCVGRRGRQLHRVTRTEISII
jgi:hypothetical protein